MNKNMIRDAVIAKLASEGITPYRLWADNKDIFPGQATLYDWLNGKQRISDSRASVLIMRLKIKIVP